MEENKIYVYLNSFLVKDDCASLEPSDFIKKTVMVNSYNLDSQYDLEGKLFVKISTENKPKWSSFTENIIGKSIVELGNQSSSAVLIIKSEKTTMAFTFGYGRFLLDMKYFVHDFGIKTALNTLDHDSLRSVDLFTLDDQAVQKKAQASRESGVSIFGIDISKDVLRAVTGAPKRGVKLQNISGGDSVFSFGLKINIHEIGGIVSTLVNYYKNDSYKKNFSWVDNIRKIKEKSEIATLDKKLIEDIKQKTTNINLTISEIVNWDEIYGFSYTRSKKEIKPTIEKEDYLKNIDNNILNIDLIKRDKMYVYDIYENKKEYSIYKCIYFEYEIEEITYILFSGVWYEIDNKFMSRIDQALSQIDISTLPFPKIRTSIVKKEGKEKLNIESEGTYNERAANEFSYHLLDRKLIKSNRTTAPIELCDLMTDNKQFIHVKHRKGGSAGLSHLFAQGNISAEVMLGDKDFRIKARRLLKKIKNGLQHSIALDSFKSNDVEIVFLILGEDSSTLKENLPFFSKVNLSKTYENLSQRGFKVTIAGVDKIM